jgi:glycosyltransferase involved in cell wall biosynthesis
MSAMPRVSVAVPIHNEELILPELIRRACAMLDSIPNGPHELLFVDDGSWDGTMEILERAAAEDHRIAIISLSRNFGHQAALTAALDHVSGDVVVVMDGDLQDSPEAIPMFLERYHQGYEVVYAQRARRKEPWYLRACYFLFYRFAARLSDTPVPLDAGDFGLMSRRVVLQLRSMREHHRYLRGLRSWVGFRQIGVVVERSARHAGTSKYSTLRLLKLASDGIFAFSVLPLRSAALFGAGAIALSVLYSLYALYIKFWLNQSPQGFTALIILITFLSGVNLLFLGIIGEYLGRVYEEIKARPPYVVWKLVNCAVPETALPRHKAVQVVRAS